MLKEFQLKKCLKEMIFMLESVQDSRFSKSDDPVKDLRAMSVMISKIEKTGKLNQMVFLAKNLDYLSFEKRILKPIKEYFKKFGASSEIWHGTRYSNPEMAKIMFFEGKSELTSIIYHMKVDNYMY